MKKLQNICKQCEIIIESIRTRIEALYAGENPSPFKGMGIEVEDFREYTIGDDFRRIDWKISSRIPFTTYPRFIVREYREERSLDSLIILDASASMNYKEKWLCAIKAVIAIVEAARKRKDRVGLILFQDNKPRLVIRPMSPAGLSNYFFNFVCKNKILPKGRNSLSQMAEKVLKLVKRRFFTFVITDIAHEIPEVIQAVNMLKSIKIPLGFIIVMDMSEVKLPNYGLITLVDLEMPVKVSFTDVSDISRASRFLERHYEVLLGELRRRDVPTVVIKDAREVEYKILRLMMTYRVLKERAYA